MSNQPNEKDSLGLLAVISSVISAFLGVQSNKKREEDFSKGKPMPFILVGLAGTLLFILTIILVVNLVLTFAK